MMYYVYIIFKSLYYSCFEVIYIVYYPKISLHTHFPFKYKFQRYSPCSHKKKKDVTSANIIESLSS